MKPLILLLVVFALTAIGYRITTENWNIVFSGNLAMSLMLCFTALGHFKFAKGMSMMIPKAIPFKMELVYLTGIAEILLGIALLFPASRNIAGIIIIIFFILILPANIQAAIQHLDYEKGRYTGPGSKYLWFRVPLQVFFIGWVWYFSL